jgi:hypothetical protein
LDASRITAKLLAVSWIGRICPPLGSVALFNQPLALSCDRILALLIKQSLWPTILLFLLSCQLSCMLNRLRYRLQRR